jgi:prepilin-type N-terminal cleavage/methylation domain-containing protein
MRTKPEKIHETKSEQPGGFTLVELMIAAGIMGVVVVGILTGYVRCMELNEVSANKSLATKAARSRMEEIKGTAFAGLATSFNSVAFPVTGFTGMGISSVDRPHF